MKEKIFFFFMPERFILTLKSKIYKYMTSVSNNIDKLDDIVNEYNNTCHSTIKMKPAGVKSSTYIDFGKDNNDIIMIKILNWKLMIM